MSDIPVNKIPVGQAFVARQTSEYAVEWVVVAVEEGAPGALLVVPADTSPAVGSADVAVPAREAGSAFTLRGRFALWVPASLVEPALFTRLLPEAACRAVAARYRGFLLGRLSGELFEIETDDDFEYQRWLAEEVEPAHRALAAAALTAAEPELTAEVPAQPASVSRFPWAPALAAGLGAVGLGLGLWVVELRQRVGEMSGPMANFGASTLDVGDTIRSEQVVELPAGSSRFVLYLNLDPKTSRFERFRLEVRIVPGARLLHEINDLRQLSGELRLVLEAPRRPDEALELRLFGVEPGALTPLGTHQLTFRRLPPG